MNDPYGREFPLLAPALWSDAACAQSDPEIWFDPQLVDLAVEICGTCPVRKACKDLALAGRRVPEGIWAGRTARYWRAKRTKDRATA